MSGALLLSNSRMGHTAARNLLALHVGGVTGHAQSANSPKVAITASYRLAPGIACLFATSRC